MNYIQKKRCDCGSPLMVRSGIYREDHLELKCQCTKNHLVKIKAKLKSKIDFFRYD